MSHEVEAISDNIVLPDGQYLAEAGDTAVVSNAVFAELDAAGVVGTVAPDLVIDNGLVEGTNAGDDDEVSLQAANVAAPAALTATAPTAMTQAAITGGESPTEAEFNALRTDLVNTRTAQAAMLADITALRTKLAALLTALSGEGKPMDPTP